VENNMTKQLGVKKNCISILRGQTIAVKTIQVANIKADAVIALVQKNTSA